MCHELNNTVGLDSSTVPVFVCRSSDEGAQSGLFFFFNYVIDFKQQARLTFSLISLINFTDLTDDINDNMSFSSVLLM